MNKTKEEDRWIDVHNDEVVIKMGFLRYPALIPRDESVWSKTPYERHILNNVKRRGKYTDMHFHSIPTRRSKVRAKLIINLKANKKYPKSTYSIICWDNEIAEILSNFVVTDKHGNVKSLVAKYFFDGRLCN